MAQPSPRPLSRTRQLQFTGLTCLLALLATVGADRALGLFLPVKAGLIFKPGSSAHYHTSEYDFTAYTNSLGFRDGEVTVKRSRPLRVVALGDSFCFGWGVSSEQSWPKQVESRLRADGLDVELDNLGQPGAGPSDYAEHAEKALPLLKPDLVVVGMLQGDDLAQCRLTEPPAGSADADRKPLRELYPNVTFLLDLHKAQQQAPLDVTGEWQKLAVGMVQRFTPEERACWDRLDAGVREKTLAGDVNPAVVYRAMKDTGEFTSVFDVTTPETQKLIHEMGHQLSRIKAVAATCGARMIVISTTYPLYSSPRLYQSFARFGFRVDSRMLTSEWPDDAIRQACEQAGVPFHTVLHEIRSAPDVDALYYPLDTHFNAQGYARYAQLIEPVVAAALKR